MDRGTSEDVPVLMKEEAEELARLGCRYIQIDAPDFGQLVDQGQRDAWERAGLSVERVFTEGADMLNELATVPGVTLGLHLCRGNYDSDWISTGSYDTISSSCSSGPPTTTSSCSSTTTSAPAPSDRIREASGFFPREQLALSTQCGFASAGPGNAISEGAQENKLRLVGEVASRVWAAGG